MCTRRSKGVYSMKNATVKRKDRIAMCRVRINSGVRTRSRITDYTGRMDSAQLELDHVFVCAPRAREDAAILSSAGLCCGLNRVHPGQGTANANFYFDNAYLELLWLRDESEVRSEAVRPIALWQRLQWLVTGACPF